MRLKQIGSAGNKTRRYHERPNETSNTEVKETMKVAITAKRVVILMMTMALAGAMVACSGAAGTPGPAGPPGEQGPSGTPAETPDPTDPTDPTVERGPVTMIKGIDPFIFNDSATGAMDTMPDTIDLTGHFLPSTGLTYSVVAPSSAISKRVDAMVVEENMLTVKLKSDAKKYENDKLMVKATDGTSSDTIEFQVRRNRGPLNAPGDGTGTAAADAADSRAVPVQIWVGSQEEVTAAARDLNTKDATGTIPIVIGALKSFGDAATNQQRYFFQDDVGNTLSFISDLSTGDAARLMVTDGKAVKLLGKKSTLYMATGEPDKMNHPITVDLLARDDGSLDADDEVKALEVHIDMAPTTKGNIGTKVITLGTTPMDKVAVRAIANYFEDDRQMPAQDTGAAVVTDLTYYVWSSDSKVASVSINAGNKSDMEFAFLTGAEDPALGGFYVEGKGRGTAMIMVKAIEPPHAGAISETPASVIYPEGAAPGNAGLKQSVTLTFMVEVK